MENKERIKERKEIIINLENRSFKVYAIKSSLQDGFQKLKEVFDERS